MPAASARGLAASWEIIPGAVGRRAVRSAGELQMAISRPSNAPREKFSPALTRISSTIPACGAGMSIAVWTRSAMASVWPARTWSPSATNHCFSTAPGPASKDSHSQGSRMISVMRIAKVFRKGSPSDAAGCWNDYCSSQLPAQDLAKIRFWQRLPAKFYYFGYLVVG